MKYFIMLLYLTLLVPSSFSLTITHPKKDHGNTNWHVHDRNQIEHNGFVVFDKPTTETSFLLTEPAKAHRTPLRRPQGKKRNLVGNQADEIIPLQTSKKLNQSRTILMEYVLAGATIPSPSSLSTPDMIEDTSPQKRGFFFNLKDWRWFRETFPMTRKVGPGSPGIRSTHFSSQEMREWINKLYDDSLNSKAKIDSVLEEITKLSKDMDWSQNELRYFTKWLLMKIEEECDRATHFVQEGMSDMTFAVKEWYTNLVDVVEDPSSLWTIAHWFEEPDSEVAFRHRVLYLKPSVYNAASPEKAKFVNMIINRARVDDPKQALVTPEEVALYNKYFLNVQPPVVRRPVRPFGRRHPGKAVDDQQ